MIKNLIPQIRKPTLGTAPRWLPAYFFFYKTLALPESMKPEEVEDFLSVQLELLAPFPQDQLAWGYCCGVDNRRVLLYAAQRKRVEAWSESNGEPIEGEPPLVAPDCFRYLHEVQAAGSLFYVRTTDSALLLEFKEQDCIPDNVFSVSASAEDSDVELFQRLDTAFRRYHPDFPETEALENYCDQLAGKTLECARGARYLLNTEGGHSEPKALDPLRILFADVRDRFWLQTRFLEFKRSQWVAKAQAVVAVVALLVALAQAIYGIQFMRITRIENALASKAEAQGRIESQQALVIKLESVSSEVARPFYRLAAASKVLPASIFFDDVTLDSLGRLRIEANADTIATINNYEQALRQTDAFESFEISGRESRRGAAQFMLTLGALKNVAPEALSTAQTVARPATEGDSDE